MHSRHSAPTPVTDGPTEFERMLSCVPGSRYIGDQWRNDSMVLFHFTVEEDWNALAWSQQSTLRCYHHWALDDDARQMVVYAPLIAAELVAWDCEEYTSYFQDIPLPDSVLQHDFVLVGGAIATILESESAEPDTAGQELLVRIDMARAAGVDAATYMAALSSLNSHPKPLDVALAMCVTPSES